MKKKQYEKPTMRVFPLEQEPQVLVGSLTLSVGATRDDAYNSEGAETWDD